MADINHVISLGIGSPAAIPEFITVGLQIGEATTTLTNPGLEFTHPNTKQHFTHPDTKLHFTLPSRQD